MNMRLIVIAALLNISVVMADTGFDILIPKPQQVVNVSGTCTVPETLGVSNEFQDLRLDALIVICPGSVRAPLAPGVEVVGIEAFAERSVSGP